MSMTPSPELLEKARQLTIADAECEFWIVEDDVCLREAKRGVCSCREIARAILTIGMAAGAEAEREACAKDLQELADFRLERARAGLDSMATTITADGNFTAGVIKIYGV